MSIYRVRKDTNYVVLNNTGLRDPRLSWKAKGLLAYMLSMPDDWKFYDEELATHARDGRDSLKSAIKELRTLGYFKRVPKQGPGGKLDGWETIVYETPQPLDGETPDSGNNRQTEEPSYGKAVRRENRQTGNTELLSINNTKYLKEQSTKKNNIVFSEEFDRFWSHYPRKLGQKKAYALWEHHIKTIPPETLIECAKNYADYCEAMGSEEQFIKHPSTFLSKKDKPFEDFVNPYPTNGRKGQGGNGNSSGLDPDREQQYRDAGLIP